MTGVKKRFQVILPLLLLILTLLFPEKSAEGVMAGAKTALLAALPALFPALVLSRLLSSANFFTKKGLPLLLGLICGFPVGAVCVCDLRERGAISAKDANRLLFCCCNTGPAFLVGFCGAGILNSLKAGWLLYGMECAATVFFFAALIRPGGGKKMSASTSAPVGLHQAISEASERFLGIGGCILFFSFLSALILTLFPALPAWALCGVRLFLEITGGVSSLSSLPSNPAFSLCAAGVGWAGLSVYLQSLGPIQKAGLDPRWYLAGRMAMTIAMFLLSFPLKKLL